MDLMNTNNHNKHFDFFQRKSIKATCLPDRKSNRKKNESIRKRKRSTRNHKPKAKLVQSESISLKSKSTRLRSDSLNSNVDFTSISRSSQSPINDLCGSPLLHSNVCDLITNRTSSFPVTCHECGFLLYNETYSSHNCVDLLRKELKRQQTLLVSLANSNSINNRNVIDHQKSEQWAFIHFNDNQTQCVAKIKLNDQLRPSDLILYAIKQFNFSLSSSSSSFSSTSTLYANDLDYQLIALGTYQFDLHSYVRQCNRVFLSSNQDLHLQMLPKRISINLLFRFEEEKLSKWIVVQIDPTATVYRLKQNIADLFSIDLSHSSISFRGVQLIDHLTLYCVGVGHNDQLSVDYRHHHHHHQQQQQHHYHPFQHLHHHHQNH